MLETADELEITPKVPPGCFLRIESECGRLQITRAKGRPETMSPEVMAASRIAPVLAPRPSQHCREAAGGFKLGWRGQFRVGGPGILATPRAGSQADSEPDS